VKIFYAEMKQQMSNNNVYQHKTELDFELEELLAYLKKFPKWKCNGLQQKIKDADEEEIETIMQGL
jgi:DNA-directed RNA polymerase subunit F